MKASERKSWAQKKAEQKTFPADRNGAAAVLKQDWVPVRVRADLRDRLREQQALAKATGGKVEVHIPDCFNPAKAVRAGYRRPKRGPASKYGIPPLISFKVGEYHDCPVPRLFLDTPKRTTGKRRTRRDWYEYINRLKKDAMKIETTRKYTITFNGDIRRPSYTVRRTA